MGGFGRSLENMKQAPLATLVVLLSCGCEKSVSSRSKALPENVVADKPIVIREGQAVLLAPEGDKSLVIVATVLDGKLNVAELDQKGRNFGITWSDGESWMTSVIDSEGSQLTLVVDEDGDGLPDRRIRKSKETIQKELIDVISWKEEYSGNKSEQAVPPKSDRAGG